MEEGNDFPLPWTAEKKGRLAFGPYSLIRPTIFFFERFIS